MVVTTIFTDRVGQDIRRALTTGWLRYPSRVLPQVTLNYSLLFSGTLGALLSAVGLHRICRWIASHRGKTWRVRWTACLMAGMAILFAAAIVMTGLLHQTVWLGREGVSGPGSFRADDRRKAEILAKAIMLYSLRHDSRFPPDLEALLTGETAPDAASLRCRSGLPWVYIPGHGVDSAEEAVIFYSPTPVRGDDVYLAYSGSEGVHEISFDALTAAITFSRQEAARVSGLKK